MQANEIFNAYREQYYEGGISSVYLWEPQEEASAEGGSAPPPAGAFAGCFLVHKGEGSGRHGGGLERGYWDAIHVAEVRGRPRATAHASTGTEGKRRFRRSSPALATRRRSTS